MTNRLSTVICAALLVQASMTAAEARDMRDVVRSSEGSVLVNRFGNCVRTRWMNDRDDCAAEPRARAAIAQEERTVYFDFNKSALRPDSRTRLNSLAQRLRSDDQVREARIIGYADRIGTASYNEQLSKRRAENVRRYLVSQKFIKSRVAETRWLGESEPVTRCADNLSRAELISCLERDRRVEVEIDYLPDRFYPARY